MKFAVLGIVWLLTLCAPMAADVATKDTPAVSENAHRCIEFYPPQLIRTGVEGETTIGFNVSVSGKIKDLHIVRSSGNAELDQASLLCASYWTYKPTISNGQPVESSQQAAIKWTLSGGSLGAANNLGKSLPLLLGGVIHRCVNYSPPFPPDKDWGKTTFVQYLVKTDGYVEGAFVAKSSGDSDFDAIAVECISHLSYRPGTVGGAAMDWVWGSSITSIPHAGVLDMDGIRTT